MQLKPALTVIANSSSSKSKSLSVRRLVKGSIRLARRVASSASSIRKQPGSPGVYLGEIYIDRSRSRGIDKAVLRQACSIVEEQAEQGKTKNRLGAIVVSMATNRVSVVSADGSELMSDPLALIAGTGSIGATMYYTAVGVSPSDGIVRVWFRAFRHKSAAAAAAAAIVLKGECRAADSGWYSVADPTEGELQWTEVFPKLERLGSAAGADTGSDGDAAFEWDDA